MTLARSFTRRHLSAYLALGCRGVKGWLNPIDAKLIASIGDLQTASGIGGAVGEVGVHHGKLAILLYLLMHDGERGFCVDVFDCQELNVDGSGRGNERRFRSNLHRFLGSDEDVTIIKSDSTTVRARDLLDRVGPVRLFSIDGGHTADITVNDLQLAQTTLAEKGVVILDDYFCGEFPGVSEGAHVFLTGRSAVIVPFAIGLNKVFLCRVEQAPAYRAKLRRNSGRYFLKESRFLGRTVDIYHRGHPRGPLGLGRRILRSTGYRVALGIHALLGQRKKRRRSRRRPIEPIRSLFHRSRAV